MQSSMPLHFLEELFNPNPHPNPLTTHNQCNINVCQIMEIHVNKENFYVRHTKQPGVLWFLFTLKLLAVWRSVFKTLEWRCLDNTNFVYFHTDQTLSIDTGSHKCFALLNRMQSSPIKNQCSYRPKIGSPEIEISTIMKGCRPRKKPSTALIWFHSLTIQAWFLSPNNPSEIPIKETHTQ